MRFPVLLAIIVVLAFCKGAFAAYICKNNPGLESSQFALAYSDGTWVDNSPSTNINVCTDQLNSIHGNLYCRINPDESYGEQFAPSFIGGDWVDASSSTDFETCRAHIQQLLNQKRQGNPIHILSRVEVKNNYGNEGNASIEDWKQYVRLYTIGRNRALIVSTLKDTIIRTVLIRVIYNHDLDKPCWHNIQHCGISGTEDKVYVITNATLTVELYDLRNNLIETDFCDTVQGTTFTTNKICNFDSLLIDVINKFKGVNNTAIKTSNQRPHSGPAREFSVINGFGGSDSSSQAAIWPVNHTGGSNGEIGRDSSGTGPTHVDANGNTVRGECKMETAPNGHSYNTCTGREF